jgi:assimilatory nitrate reductase catalytic subunit
MFGDGRFFTSNGTARLIAVEAPRVACKVSDDWPFVLNTGRIRDQWHTMTRTGLSPRLASHIAEPFVEVHPEDAARFGLEQGRLARVETIHGATILRVLVSRGQQPGSLFAPIHWSAENASSGPIDALVQPASDPHSGQPESKATPARIAAAAASHFGFALSRRPLHLAGLIYWAAARTAFGHMLNFALDAPANGWQGWLREALSGGERAHFADAAIGIHRVAVQRGGRLEAVVCIGPDPKLPSPEWLKSQFERRDIPARERRTLLAGRPLEGVADEGPIVCVCFQVGARRIETAAAAGDRTLAKIGARLGAGTNCGSCVPEIRRLLEQKEAAREPA